MRAKQSDREAQAGNGELKSDALLSLDPQSIKLLMTEIDDVPKLPLVALKLSLDGKQVRFATNLVLMQMKQLGFRL
jgi:hypothetical protein